MLLGQDVNHIKNVLRCQKGEHIEICNSETSKNYLCEINKIEKEEIECNILENLRSNVETDIKVTIFQGLPKADKMEYIIQKSVELGAYDITPVEMKRCIVKLNEKDKEKKIQRWQKIAEVAAKQCKRDIIPKINNITNVKLICNIIQNYDIILVAYEKEKERTLKSELKKIKEYNQKNIGIIIGPEGGLDEDDVKLLEESGAKVITLGNRILRTETVALNVLSNIMYELEI
ncbi:MAG TPA: 16S rRNA (uracil(1498)-N(3))-methyltransferase [Clostridiaceae bacterium]|nr:16S rRNA (uracil(1498)-N(3))-methyltransferase [Clostridiaceae bacterium]